ncbi:E3 ubiquitin-protein ligase-like [Centropristis striata]|uniref:E3 ubiquitin-protein ligase-like n=1 Tax=Centropristis striata TaxID=184440 RepID=UPI0027DEE3C7|nr:E3 ubiquitin-protein ligase-like [Centropristis striata]
MYSEHECGICYLTYNTGVRCPRELHCKHSFCESCLLALSRPLGADGAAPGADRLIVCPLCRDTTSISGERKLRAQLRVDECVLERLVASGVLYGEEGDPEEEGEEGLHRGDVTGKILEPPAEESVSLAGSRGGRHRRCCRKVWKILSGQSSRPRSRENIMTNEDLRNYAMMTCYMF